MSASNYVHLDVDEVLRETDKAFLISLGGEEFWVPKSQIADAGGYEEGDVDCVMSVTKWFADKQGIEG